MYKKLDDEFFTFTDFNGNEAVLYSDQGRIFVPNCIQITQIEIIEKTEKCYNDLPALIKINNQTISVFLTEDLILKQTGKLISCDKTDKTLFWKTNLNTFI